MEGEKETEQQQQEEKEKLAQGRGKSDDDHGMKMDSMVKMRLIRESIVNGGKEESMINITQNPDHVLAFSRSVYKIDSSLE